MSGETQKSGLPLNHQKFKLCASGTGLIVFQVIGPTSLRVLLSFRSKDVGEGFGITGGGFVECADVLRLPINSIIQTADEAHRENCEENIGFETVVDIDDFIERAQPMSLIHARTDDVNEVHAVTMFGLRSSSDSEWRRIAALAPGKERKGPLLEYVLSWDDDCKIDRRTPENDVRLRNKQREPIDATNFWHKHEMHTIACIAWHAQNNRLW